jgi:hypothetical protein
MKATTDASRRLRQSNPVPNDAFRDAASDSLGLSAFADIIIGPAPVTAGRAQASKPAGRSRSLAGRLSWRFAVPGVAAVAAAAMAVAVTSSGAAAPHQPGGGRVYRLDAFLSVHPAAGPRDAAAVLRLLAARAAMQPAQPLGPVEFSSKREWEDVGDRLPRDFNNLIRNSYSDEAWDAISGATAVRIVRNSDGKAFAGRYLEPGDPALAAWSNPATLPSSPGALRERLLHEPQYHPPGRWLVLDPAQSDFVAYVGKAQVSLGNKKTQARRAAAGQAQKPHGKEALPPLELVFTSKSQAEQYLSQHKHAHFVDQFPDNTPWQALVFGNAFSFMTGEPLPPAVRATMFELMAEIAASPWSGQKFVNLGTATDRLGRTGLAIAAEQADSAGPDLVGVGTTIFDPRTGAILDTADAQCKIPFGSIPTAQAQCAPTDYTEYGAPRAVPSIPDFPLNVPGLIHQAGGPYF